MRRTLFALMFGLGLIASGPASAQTFDADPEVSALFLADQTARQSDTVSEAQREIDDAGRRQAMRALLAAGRLVTADDFFLAAFVFQHGRGDDCLLAHALATVAVAKGKTEATLIAAATLDRYLQDIGKAQIYGTQFMVPFNGDPATQSPYAPEFLPDSVRTAMGVPTVAEQAEQVRMLEAQR